MKGKTGVHDGDVGNRVLNAPVPGVTRLLTGQARVMVRVTVQCHVKVKVTVPESHGSCKVISLFADSLPILHLL